MKTKKILPIALSAAAAAFWANAADVSIEGQWLVNGSVQRSVDTTCQLKFYGAENAASALCATNGVRFATDAGGCFVVCASSPDGVSLPDTFWVGVTPAGRDEISPRFRIAPVPFAFAADEVRLVSTDRELELTGVATIDRLSVSGNVDVEDFVVSTNSVLNAKNLQIDSAKIVSLDIPYAGMFGLFNANGATPSIDYDTFPAEREARVEAYIEDSGSFLIHDQSKTRTYSLSHTFGGDGFLLIAIRAEPKQCPAPALSVKIGEMKVYDRNVGVDKGGVVKRLMNVPYRSGERVQIDMKAVGGGEVPYREQDSYKSNIGVKLRLVKFGRD